MKKTIFALLCVGFMLAGMGMSAAAQDTKTVKFDVSMTCENCVEKITENVSFEKGVKDLNVSLENKTVEVTYDSSKTDEATLSEAISNLGYTVALAPSEERTLIRMDENVRPMVENGERPEKMKGDTTAKSTTKAGEKIKETANKVGDKTVETADKVGDKTVETADKVGDKTVETADKVGDKTKETADKVGDKTKETANKVGDKTKETANKVGDFFKKDKTE